ncbi:MAG: hypothetical protein MUF29_00330 [Chitinophagaceae bacterium]|jgi:hypothetical protein|nr:hypothetical protein [Chitinophagaceae bacterium]
MKKMMLALAVLALTTGIWAQGGPGKGQRMGQGMGPCGGGTPGKGQAQRGMAANARLNLTPEQQTKARQLQEQFRQQMQELNKNEGITVKEQRAKREQLMKAHRQEMDKLLTPEQKQLRDQQRQSNRKIAQYRSDIRLEQMKTKLQLTDKQASALKSSHEAMQKKAEAIRNNEGLDRTTRMEQMTALRNQWQADLEKTLTKEQLQQWKDSQPGFAARGGKGMGRGAGRGPGRGPGNCPQCPNKF